MYRRTPIEGSKVEAQQMASQGFAVHPPLYADYSE